MNLALIIQFLLLYRDLNSILMINMVSSLDILSRAAYQASTPVACCVVLPFVACTLIWNFICSFFPVSVRKVFNSLSIGPFTLGDQLVSSDVLETIHGELMGVTKHSDALKIFGKYGIKASSQALSMFGYKVKWSGLDPENAEILKI